MKNTQLDYSTLQKEYDGDSQLGAAVKQIVQTMFTEGTLSLPVTENPIFSLALEHQMIVKAAGHNGHPLYFPAQKPQVYFAIYKAMGEDDITALAANVTHAATLTQQLQGCLGPGEKVTNRAFFQDFHLFCLLLCDDPYSKEREDQVMQLEITDPSFAQYFNAYMGNESISSMAFESVWNTLNRFAGKVGYPQPGGANSWWQQLPFVSDRIFKGRVSDIDQAKRICMDNIGRQDGQAVLASGFMMAMRENHHILTEEVMEIFRQPATRWLGNALLISEPIVDPSHLSEIISEVKKIEAKDLDFANAVLLIIHIDSTTPNPDPDIKIFCTKYIITALHSRQEVVVRQSILLMGVAEGMASRYCSLIIDLLKSPEWEDSYLPVVNQFYIQQGELDLYFAFIRASVEMVGKRLATEDFEDGLNFFNRKDPVSLDRAIVMLMTDNEGVFRYTGLKLITNLYRRSEDIKPAINLLELSEELQFKFALTLNFDRYDAELHIRLWAPLLGTSSPIVWELVMSSLEGLIEDYKIKVIELLTPVIEHLRNKSAVLERLDAYWENFYKQYAVKFKIKELDSRIVYPELYKSYMQQFINKTRDIKPAGTIRRNSILSKIKKTTVARGGGIVRPDGTIHPFMTTSASFTVPRSAYITPEIMEIRQHEYFNTNWNKDNDPWEQAFLSFRNT